MVRGLRIVDPGLEGPAAELVHLEEVYLRCSTELDELLKGEPEVTHVVIRRPTLRPTRLPDGSWSTARLLPLPSTSRTPPEIRIENGTIEIGHPQSGTLTLRELQCVFSPPGRQTEPDLDPRLRKFHGTFTSDRIRKVEVEGLVDPHGSKWAAGGSIESLEISPELREVLPDELKWHLFPLASLRGELQLRFQASHDPERETPFQFDVSGNLAQGQFRDPRLPHPLTDLRAKIACDNAGVTIEDLYAHCGLATLRLTCRREGYHDQAPMTVQAWINDLDLDQSLVDVLPDSFREPWNKFLPTGQISAGVKLTYDGQRWFPEMTVDCVKASFTYYKFPYRLEQVHGTLKLKDDVLTANLTGYTGGQAVRVKSEVRSPLSRPYGWVTADGENLPLDEKLFTALPLKPRAVIRSLNPRGTIDFSGMVRREEPDGPVHRELVAVCNRCTIQYEKFPYPISNITGKLHMLDDQWGFENLKGTNDSGVITCEGSLGPTQTGSRLELRLAGTSVRFEDELRAALPANMQQVWDHFRPQGMFDFHDAVIQFDSGEDRFSVALQAEPQSQNASIQPVYFPYRLDKLSGLLDYRDGRVVLSKFHGAHGNVGVRAAGQCDFLPDGGWRFQLGELTVDRCRFDRELVQALPGPLKRAIAGLNPEGPLDLRGGVILARGGNPEDPLVSEWDLEVGFARASIDFGVRLDNIHGKVRLLGNHDGTRFRCRGDVNLFSVMYKDLQFTQVSGPVWIDGERVLFGTWVDRPPPGQGPTDSGDPNRPPRSMAAQLFGGSVLWDAWILLGETPRYSLQAKLFQADLARFAQEAIPGRQELRGKIHAEVELRGAGRSVNLLSGRGNVRLRDADIYELPVMVKLLKLLSLNRPDKTAFSSSDIDFRIDGNHLYFDPDCLCFNGDAISLKGKGQMDFQGSLDLTFRAVVGRGDREVPVLREMLGGASQQIMQIHVGGTLQNPDTRRESFPGVNHALQQLQSERKAEGRGVLGRFQEAWRGGIVTR